MNIQKNNSNLKIKRYLELAENGASSFQCFLASEIISDNNYPNRMVESLKWILIAKILEDQLAHDSIVDFLCRAMSEVDVDIAFKLAENWIEEKIKIASQSSLDSEVINWTNSLKRIAKINF